MSRAKDSRFMRCACRLGSKPKQDSAKRCRETSDMAANIPPWSAKVMLTPCRASLLGNSLSVAVALMPSAPLSQVNSPVRSGP